MGVFADSDIPDRLASDHPAVRRREYRRRTSQPAEPYRQRNASRSQRNADRWFDTNAFIALTNTPGQLGFFPNQIYGNSGVGIVRGPGSQNLDFNLAKDFRLTERFNAQFRAEFFNALNRTNFGVPGVTIGAGFGQIVSAADARIIQFAMKLRF